MLRLNTIDELGVTNQRNERKLFKNFFLHGILFLYIYRSFLVSFTRTI